jgi:aspartyl-tRNA(Asn)/glutamyl-tRNA(Gln) amidotransferase subunit B
VSAAAKSPSAYEAVIGLEVHVQLKTRSKMFTRVATGFGEPPNTLTDPVVLALPGTLPVYKTRRRSTDHPPSVLLCCAIAPVCQWEYDYFYPDRPEELQISNTTSAICQRGGSRSTCPAGRTSGRAQDHNRSPAPPEEESASSNTAPPRALSTTKRAGTRSSELVTDPALKSADEAFDSSPLSQILSRRHLRLRHEKGQIAATWPTSPSAPSSQKELGTKVELKNLNSISFVRDGIAHEIQRQIAVVLGGGTIRQETRDYDGQTGTSQSLRSKEMAHDYRYFPDPDLMPVKVDEAWKARLREGLPELPFDKQRRFFDTYKLPYTITSVLVPDRALSDYFEETAKLAGVAKAQAVGNWIANDLLRELGAAGIELAASKVRPAHIAALVALVEGGAISSSSAKEVFVEMFQSGEMPEPIVDRRGLRQSNDTGELEKWCQDAIAGNPKAVAEYKSGNEKAINSLKGPVMKAGKGKANPKLVDEVLRKLLAAG